MSATDHHGSAVCTSLCLSKESNSRKGLRVRRVRDARPRPFSRVDKVVADAASQRRREECLIQRELWPLILGSDVQEVWLFFA